jgi:hypothetical protein
MLKLIRKHNKWLMVGFGILLMLAWSSGPALERLGRVAGNRVVARLNGENIRASDASQAYQEIAALSNVAPGLLGAIGVEPRDSTHWLLLVHEAKAAGLVGEASDGRDFLPELTRALAEMELERARQIDFQSWIQFVMSAGSVPAAIDTLAMRYEAMAPGFFRDAHMNESQMYEALARFRGVLRLVMMHNRAPRYSDRLAILESKAAQDSAVVDYLFIPAEQLAETIPDPTPEQLEAHFEQFRSTPPGEGAHGIGYLLPPRVKLEWLTLDRAGIEQAIAIDPVEVHKRHRQQRSIYPGEFAEERPRIEGDMRNQQVTLALQAARSAVQAEVMKATRQLAQDGRFRRVPDGWTGPGMHEIAAAIVEAVARNDGPAIPAPQVQRIDDSWLTRPEIAGRDDLGQAVLVRGDRSFAAHDVVFSVRELGGQGPVALQTGIPLEHMLNDWEGNRIFFLKVLATREESPPDSVEEIREQAVRDFKVLAAYRQLEQRAEQLQELARREGIEAVLAATAIPGREAPQVRQGLRVFRDHVDGGDPNLIEAPVRKTIVEAAAGIDPFTSPEQIPPERGILAVPSERALGLAMVRIRAKAPLTFEDYRRIDQRIVQSAQQRELREASAGENPFSLAALLRRHNYMAGDQRITAPEELRQQDEFDLDPEG